MGFWCMWRALRPLVVSYVPAAEHTARLQALSLSPSQETSNTKALDNINELCYCNNSKEEPSVKFMGNTDHEGDPEVKAADCMPAPSKPQPHK